MKGPPLPALTWSHSEAEIDSWTSSRFPGASTRVAHLFASRRLFPRTFSR
jgi:hypothetical protein